jgi:hypothetical protein
MMLLVVTPGSKDLTSQSYTSFLGNLNGAIGSSSKEGPLEVAVHRIKDGRKEIACTRTTAGLGSVNNTL